MPSILNPYISFKDNAREALEFYQGVFGGNLMLSTFKEAQASQTPADDNKLMHGQLTADNGIVLMAADTPEAMEYAPPSGASISISLGGDNEAELTGYWEKLVSGGSITVPLEKAPWGDTFGMLTDKFGVDWLVNISGSQAEFGDGDLVSDEIMHS